MPESDAIVLDGGESQLYMRFSKKLRSAQGMDIYGEHAYILYDTGYCAVYDLKRRNSEPLGLFKLGSFNDGVPTKDYLNHANSCMFGTRHFKNNSLPLLYVTIGTGVGYDEDGFYYRCAVENIVESVNAKGEKVFQAETLQVISYQPEGIEKTPYEAPCWGCPAFFVDTEGESLYIFSARYRTKRDCVPAGRKNAYIITRFSLPDLDQGSMVHLTPGDILDQFSVECDALFTQGGQWVDNKIIYTFGCPKLDYRTEILVFDIEKRALTHRIYHMDEALNYEEIECCGLYQGKLLCNTCDGGIYQVHTRLFEV